MALAISNFATLTLPRALTISTISLFNSSLRYLSSTSNFLPPSYKYKYNARHNCTLGLSNFSTTTTQCVEEEGSKKVDVITRSPRLVALEYADLNLHIHCQGFGHIRLRQQVNPLRSCLSVPAEPPDWNVVYKDSSLPLMVDIGCVSCIHRPFFFVDTIFLARECPTVLLISEEQEEDYKVVADFSCGLRRLNSDSCNYLGLEIREQCPNPHFKTRHHKRRVLQKPLVDSIVNNLGSHGQVFVQSDVLEVAVDMRNRFDGLPNLPHIDTINPNFGCDSDGWLLRKPMGIRTEREIHREFEGAKIYRRLYQKHT